MNCMDTHMQFPARKISHLRSTMARLASSYATALLPPVLRMCL